MATKRKQKVEPLNVGADLEEWQRLGDEVAKLRTQPDPRRCYCKGVQRRWDGDGLMETTDEGEHLYRCTVCGKLYSDRVEAA